MTVGGAANQLIQLIQSYEKNEDIKISIITKYSEYIPKTNRVKIYQLHKFNFTLLNSIYFMVKSIVMMINIHKKEQIDIININGHPFSVLSVYIIRVLFKIPIIMKMPLDFNSYIRRVYMLEDDKIKARIFNFSFFKFFKAFLFKKTDYIRAINHQMHIDLVNSFFPEKRILDIPNGINYKEFAEIKKKNRENTRFGFVGRLTEFKNLRFLLDVFKIYLTKYPKDKLFIYGSGSEEKYILDFIRKNNLEKSIIFHGFEKNKNKIYSNLDAIIDPALGQGISNTNLEAMCSKTFIIASNTIGNRDLIKNQIIGLLFNPFKKNDLLKKLIYFKERKESVQKILKNAEETIKSEYDIDVISHKIYSVLRSKTINLKKLKI